MLTIPKHINCINCGLCCGPVPATKQEIKHIKEYITKHQVAIFKTDILGCPFRNEDMKKCEIYPVRPTVCRLMGVCKEMECPNGNSANINGNSILPPSKNISDLKLLSMVDWR